MDKARKFGLVGLLLFAVMLTGCAAGPQVKELNQRVVDLESRVNEIESSSTGTAVSQGEAPMEVVIASEPPSPRRDPAKLTDRDVQRALRAAGYYTGSIDGKIGPMTDKAIRKFQKDHGLKVDGILGPRTKRALVRNIDW